MKDTHRVRIASLQYFLRPVASFEAFAEQATDWARNAHDYKCELLVYPEYFTLQLLSLFDPDLPLPELVRKVATLTEDYQALFAKLAREFDLTIVAGSMPVVDDQNRVHNEAHVFSKAGGHGVQQKLRMTRFEKEDFHVQPGDPGKLRIFESTFGKFAVAICFDVEFPEIVRAAALAGAQIIIVPSCTDDRQGYYRVRHCAQARAIENQVFVIQSSTVGGLSRYPATALNYGQAAILTPSDYGFSRDGLLLEGVANTETMIVGELDMLVLEESHSRGTVLPREHALSTKTMSEQIEFVQL